MTRLIARYLFLATAIFALTISATAGSLLPKIRLPRINVGKAAEALAYPVTKSVVNGGKTVLKVGAAADGVGLIPNIGPAPVSKAVKKTLWELRQTLRDCI